MSEQNGNPFGNVSGFFCHETPECFRIVPFSGTGEFLLYRLEAYKKRRVRSGRGVAQSGSASALGAEGRRVKSVCPGQVFSLYINLLPD